MRELHIDDELKAWIDPLSPEEYAQLEANIRAEGCRDPIVVWGDYILDGHNRYEICTRNNIAFSTVKKSGLVTKDDALVWMAQNQLGKRNLSDFTRVALALRLKPLLEQRAKERMVAGKAIESDPTQKSAEGSGETREAIAKVAGVSRDTVRKVETILDSGNAEVAAQVRSGEISINAAAKKVAPPRQTTAPITSRSTSPTSTDAAAPPLSAAGTTDTDAPDFGAVSPTPAAPLTVDDLGDDGADFDVMERLIAAEKQVEQLERERDELKARVLQLETGDLASQIVKLEQDVRSANGRAERRFEEFTKANDRAIARQQTLDRIRRAAGVGKDVDLVEWVKQAARRAA